MFVWPSPSKFPRVATDLGSNQETMTARTNMDSGRIRQRKRFTAGWRTLPVSWELSDAQVEYFEAMLYYKLSNGVDFFEMELPDGEGGFQTYTVRFVDGKYSKRYKDVMFWRVSATLERQTVTPLMSEATLNAWLE